MNQIWIVRAETYPGLHRLVYEYGFPDRATAHALYARGEREVRQLHWSLNMVPFNEAEHAAHDIDLLKEEYAE